MGRALGLVAAVLMVLLGGLWTLQGLGYVGGGSSMTGSDTWAIVGPVVAGLGVALGIVVAQRRS
jgi:hypothetical protein